MHASSFTSFLALFFFFFASGSFARIVGIQSPTSVVYGKSLKVTVLTQDYVQNWEDFAIVWGYSTEGSTSITTYVATDDLVSQGHSNTGTGQFIARVPAPTTSGSFQLVAAVTYATGAADNVGLAFFNATIDATSGSK